MISSQSKKRGSTLSWQRSITTQGMSTTVSKWFSTRNILLEPLALKNITNFLIMIKNLKSNCKQELLRMQVFLGLTILTKQIQLMNIRNTRLKRIESSPCGAMTKERLISLNFGNFVITNLGLAYNWSNFKVRSTLSSNFLEGRCWTKMDVLLLI